MRWLITCPEDSASRPVYLAWMARAGMAGQVLPRNYAHPGSIDAFEGLLLAGGADIAPASYGDRIVHAATYGIDTVRDDVELRLFGEFVAAGKPVFGICRGIQVLNVALGGGLIQDVPDALGGAAGEEHRRQPGYDARHALTVDASTSLGADLAGVTEVNSAHHQAIDPARLGRGVRIVARSGKGIVEAAEVVGTPAAVCAVQWHPERLEPDDPASVHLISRLSRTA